MALIEDLQLCIFSLSLSLCCRWPASLIHVGVYHSMGLHVSCCVSLVRLNGSQCMFVSRCFLECLSASWLSNQVFSFLFFGTVWVAFSIYFQFYDDSVRRFLKISLYAILHTFIIYSIQKTNGKGSSKKWAVDLKFMKIRCFEQMLDVHKVKHPNLERCIEYDKTFLRFWCLEHNLHNQQESSYWFKVYYDGLFCFGDCLSCGHA